MAGGLCSYPIGRDIIAINNGGIRNGGIGWLHEVGHYLSLKHTFDCGAPRCDPDICTGEGAHHDSPRGETRCLDVCPDAVNVMSYHNLVPDIRRAVFTRCQLAEMDIELSPGTGARSPVVRPADPSAGTGIADETRTVFLRGDSNGDSRMDVSDAIFTLGFLFSRLTSTDCPDALDSNDDGAVDISDAVTALAYLFLGSRFPDPGPRFCSPDPTSDSLERCSSYAGSCEVQGASGG